ncbi:hypothetical protein OE88DRAFT_1671106 [Heliocybe sulcata]|uniref:Large ribosomal subunit protein bL32m n=1 Tax=Heliocybe sulcata TaxID=5364 RepID=A0A5C3NIN6_9AGAM|nr:hypothetical protein OE88DRAFT_1671106 [Heliocybe sulcata]
MAALALRQTSSIFSLHRASFLGTLLSSIPLVSAALSPPSPRWTIPTLQSLLDLFPPFLLAVPKKKVSHSRKGMRSALKGLKDKLNLVHCPACGSPKLAHNLCPNCYSQLSRSWKQQMKEQP